jgi:cobalt-zinc-cadmium efflux system membrane fusion protein
MNKHFLTRVAPLALLALPLAACGSAETEEAGHSEEAEAPEGPHGGRLLTDGKLSVEVTIYEAGQDPQYRVYPYPMASRWTRPRSTSRSCCAGSADRSTGSASLRKKTI